MKIVICDDEKIYVDKVYDIVKKYCENDEISCYENAEQLLNDIENSTYNNDIYILDIEIDNVKVDAEKCTEKEMKQLRLKTSMVFQNYNIFKNKTVIENVMLPMTSVQKIEKEIAKEKALQYLDQVGLLDKVNEYPSRLSGGQQQRVGIARAMAVNPKLILLDEPTSSLDPELVLGILDILRNLANEHKRTMIIVTHEMSFAKEIADRIIFMDDGRIIEEGTPEKIFSNPQNERTKRFLERFQTF